MIETWRSTFAFAPGQTVIGDARDELNKRWVNSTIQLLDAKQVHLCIW